MSERGDRYRETSLTNMICSASAELGFPGYSPHGLRHLAGSALGEAGCSTPEMMFILGHLTEKEAAAYVKQARRKVMARSAMDEWAGNVKVFSTALKKL
jgi:integrase